MIINLQWIYGVNKKCEFSTVSFMYNYLKFLLTFHTTGDIIVLIFHSHEFLHKSDTETRYRAQSIEKNGENYEQTVC